MNGNPLYNLHPVFEFTLTACFTMLIAPKFLNDIFGDFIPLRFRDKTDSFMKRININFNIAKQRLERYEHMGIGTGFLKQSISELRMLVSEFNNGISNYKMPDYSNEAKEFIDRINSLYRLILPLGCIYSLIILLINGCDPILHKLDKFYYELSFFNIIVFLFFIFLRFRNRLFFWKLRVVNAKSMLIVLFVMFIFSFKLIPFFSISYSLIEFSNVFVATVVGTLVVAFFPIGLYVIDVYIFQSSMDEIINKKKENQDLVVLESRVLGLISDIAQQIQDSGRENIKTSK